jgi:hypothetical protein
MVTFQAYYESQPQQSWDYFAQRVRASDGALLGPNITISATTDFDNNGDVAYDSDLNQYLVVYDGGVPSPWGQFVSPSGALMGARFPIGSSTDDFRGGMSAIAWNPVTKEYLATWASCCSANNFARRLSQTGAYLSEPFRTNGNVMGFGNWDPIAAVNTTNGEFLVCWYWQYDNVYVRRYQSYPPPPIDTDPPPPISGLAVARYAHSAGFTWSNPAAQDFAGTLIRVKTGSFPSGPADGVLVADVANAPASSDACEQNGLARGTYYFAFFAHDEVPNYAAPVLVRVNILAGDFEDDGDIDSRDFAHLQVCLSGDAVAYASGCRDADLDGDGDVDAADAAAFISCMGGADLPPGC